MSVKTLDDRELLKSMFLDTGSSDILDMLEGRNRGGVLSVISALNARIMSAAPVVIGLGAIILYR